MVKKELRKLFHAQRLALSTAEYSSKCVLLCNRFFSDIDLTNDHVIHSYLSIDKNKEPDTWLIINRIHSDFPQIRISVPRIKPGTRELENFYMDTLRQMVTNEWGIPEPVSGTETPIDQIDVILVPLLAFDLRGHRVGYGKGYYDRFLMQCRPGAKRIGISFFPPVERIEDTNDDDVLLDYCITPEKTFEFTKLAPADSDSGKIPVPR